MFNSGKLDPPSGETQDSFMLTLTWVVDWVLVPVSEVSWLHTCSGFCEDSLHVLVHQVQGLVEIPKYIASLRYEAIARCNTTNVVCTGENH